MKKHITGRSTLLFVALLLVSVTAYSAEQAPQQDIEDLIATFTVNDEAC